MAKDTRVTGWVGWIYFAGFILIINGILQIISGLAALLNGDFYAAQNGTIVIFNLEVWGWVHLVAGIIATCIGTALFSGRKWARVAAVILASFNLIAYFTFISAYPIWSGIAMLLNFAIIYALIVHGDEAAIEG